MLSVLLFAFASASAAAAQSAPPNELSVHHVAVLDNFLVENLAVRQNRRVLVTTSAPAATLWQIDPLSTHNATLAVRFPGVSGSYGITELQQDLFYVTTGNFSIQTRQTVPKSFRLFEVDMTSYSERPNGTELSPPTVRQVATLADAILLNGLTHVHGQDGYVLAADSYAGVIWKVDIATGNVTAAIKDASMDPTPSEAAGINGLKYQNGFLYYTNTGTNTYYRVPIYPNATASGSPEVIAQVVKGDDLILDDSGTAYICQQVNSLSRVTLNGTQQVIAGTPNSNSSSLLGPTAVAFGRGASDRNTLYITTNGGQSAATGQTPASQGLSSVDLGAAAAAVPSGTSGSSPRSSTSGGSSQTPTGTSPLTNGAMKIVTPGTISGLIVSSLVPYLLVFLSGTFFL